jgi:hypothetical protein
MMGIQPSEFWDLTPREFEEIEKCYMSKKEQELELALMHANINAIWQRSEKIPDIKEVIEDIKSKKSVDEEQNDERMMTVIKALNAKFGGKEFR